MQVLYTIYICALSQLMCYRDPNRLYWGGRWIRWGYCNIRIDTNGSKLPVDDATKTTSKDTLPRYTDTRLAGTSPLSREG